MNIRNIFLILISSILLIACKAEIVELDIKTKDVFAAVDGEDGLIDFEAKFSNFGELNEETRVQVEALENILTKLTTIGALYLTLVCLMPEFLIAKYPIPFYLGGTSILIVVVVAIDTVTQIQTRLMSSQYEQLIKKTKFGK